MQFMSDVYVDCPACKGKRYNRETLDVRFKGLNIADVLEMTVEDASVLFRNQRGIKAKLDTMMAVGLGYLTLGQSATTLSGGEAQRIKLSLELSRRQTGDSLYILDEPTTGLHLFDIQNLMNLLFQLRDQGNTIVLIEHNLDVVRLADWIVELGPDGGENGGKLVYVMNTNDYTKKPALVINKLNSLFDAASTKMAAKPVEVVLVGHVNVDNDKKLDEGREKMTDFVKTINSFFTIQFGGNYPFSKLVDKVYFLPQRVNRSGGSNEAKPLKAKV